MQRQKDEVRQRILAAALKLFAQRGYQQTTMARIATAADIATGNLYRYFESKEDLFAAVMPDAFVQELLALITRKVTALDGVDDIRSLPADSQWHRVSTALLDFCMSNRLRMIILYTGAAGSPLSDVPERIIGVLKKLALEHFRSVSPTLSPTRIHLAGLDLTYRNFIQALSAILLKFKREQDVRQALQALIHYHLAGLRAMFRMLAE